MAPLLWRLAGNAAFDGVTGEVFGVGALLIHEFAAGDHGCGAIHDEEKLGFFFVDGGVTDRAAIFEVGAVGSERQKKRLHQIGLVGFAFGLGFGNERGSDVGGGGIGFRCRSLGGLSRGRLCLGALHDRYGRKHYLYLG